MTDDAPEDQDSEEAQKDAALRYWSGVVGQALGPIGLVYVEGYTCEKCGHRQFTSHTGVEILACCNCQARIPSTAPRRPVTGEVRADHYVLAINTMYSIARERQTTGLSPISQQEMASLPDAVKHLLARQAEDVRATTLQKAVSVARALSDIG